MYLRRNQFYLYSLLLSFVCLARLLCQGTYNGKLDYPIILFKVNLDVPSRYLEKNQDL